MVNTTFGLGLQSSAKCVLARQIDLLCFETAKVNTNTAIRKSEDMNGQLLQRYLTKRI